MRVYKRNGEIENFDKNKIITAINKAFIEVDGVLYETETAEDIADAIERFVGLNQYPVPIEKIQDRIENYLMRSERLDVARAYIRYRYKREVVRGYTDDMLKEISNKLKAKNVQNQNANVDEQSFGGRMGEAGGVVWKKYALDHCVSQMARENHLNNEIYIHDLDSYAVGMHNCLTIPFDKLLAEGFNTRQTDVRPAGSVNTAFQLVAVIFQLESLQQFGGVSASHIDWTMVPYVRKSFVKHYKKGLKFIENIEVDEKMQEMWGEDKTKASIEDTNVFTYKGAYNYAMEMLKEEIHQAVEGLYHNLNTLQSRSGNQLPFTSINYGTCSLPEGRLIIDALLDVSIEGLGSKRRTSIFPCGIFQCAKGINRAPGDPNYDLFRLALKSTAQRLYPNYANVDWSGNAGYDINDPTTYFSTINKTVA